MLLMQMYLPYQLIKKCCCNKHHNINNNKQQKQQLQIYFRIYSATSSLKTSDIIPWQNCSIEHHLWETFSQTTLQTGTPVCSGVN